MPLALQEVALKGTNGDTLNLDEQERETILKALAQAHGNKKKAAEILGIHRPTLYSKLKRYEIKL
jgi:transcriptional regulator with PAS, ATPase and Fis domain